MVKKILVGLGILGLVMSLGVGQAKAASLTGYDTIDTGNSNSKVYSTADFFTIRTDLSLLGIKVAEGGDIKVFGNIVAGRVGTEDIGSATREWGNMFIADSKSFQMGSDQDVTMGWDGTDFDILAAADASVIKFGTGTESFDIWWYGNSSSNTVKLDEGANTVTFDNVDLVLTPQADAEGTADGTIYYDTDDNNLYVRANSAWVDLTAGDTGTFSLDDSYNQDSGERTITIDEGTVSWDVTGAYDYVVDIQGEGNFIIQDAGTAMFTVADGGATTLIGAFTVGVNDTGHDVKFFGATLGSYLLWDESENRLELDGADINLQADDILQFGDSQELSMRWDGTDFDILAATDDTVIKFGDGTESFDIWWYGEDATNYVEFDAGADKVVFDNIDLYLYDDDQLFFGNGSDVYMRWDNADFDVLGAAADTVWNWGASAGNSFDMVWHGEAASDAVTFDASANTWTYDDVDLLVGDDDTIGIGDSGPLGDVQIRWDGTDLDILAAADDYVIKFGDGTESFDIWWYGDTAAKNMVWDASNSALTITGGAAATALNIATGNTVLGGDFTIDTDVFIVDASANTVTVGASSGGKDYDVLVYGNTAAALMLWDASDDRLELNGADINLQADDILQFGDSQELSMRWDGTDFDILAATDDTVIKFGDGTESFDIWWYGEDATNYVEFDAGADKVVFDNIDLYLYDDDQLFFGNGSDVYMRWDNADFDVLGAAADTVWNWGASAGNSFDMVWHGEAASDAVTFDASANTWTYDDVDLLVGDDDTIGIGDSGPLGDVQIRWDGTDLDILAAADDYVIKFGDGTESFDIWWYANEATNYVEFDAGADKVVFDNIDFYLLDNDKLFFGNGSDVVMDWDNSNFDILAAADDTSMRFGASNDKAFDILFYGDVTNEQLDWDASSAELTIHTVVADTTSNSGLLVELTDNSAASGVARGIYVDIKDGTASPDAAIEVLHEDTGQALTVGMKIQAAASATITKAIEILAGESGAITTALDVSDAEITTGLNWGTSTIKGSGDIGTADVEIGDVFLATDKAVKFGAGQNVTMDWDGTNFDILAAANASVMRFGDGTQSWDIWWYGSEATNTVIFDEGADTVTLDNIDIYMGDNDLIDFGDAQDLKMRWDGTDFDILALTDDTVIKFGDGTESWDIWWYGEDATNYVEFDASADKVVFDNIDLYLYDDDQLFFGNGSDVYMRWDNADFDVLGAAADTVWNWGASAGNSFDMVWHGEAASDAVTFDASANTWTYDDVDLLVGDDDTIGIGDSGPLGDVQIRWDGTDLDILAAADDYVIKFGDGTESFDIWWYANEATNYVEFDAGADKVVFDNIDLEFGDDDKLAFGDNASGTDQFIIFYDEAGNDDLIIGDGSHEWIVIKAQTETEASLSVNGWIRPYVESTAPGAIAPQNPVKGALAVDGGEHDCFAAGDGTNGGSLCVYSGSAWVVVASW